MAQKRAKIYAVCFDVVCPYCDEPMESDYSGSQLWNRSEMGDDFIATCSACGKDVRINLPQRVAVSRS